MRREQDRSAFQPLQEPVETVEHHRLLLEEHDGMEARPQQVCDEEGRQGVAQLHFAVAEAEAALRRDLQGAEFDPFERFAARADAVMRFIGEQAEEGQLRMMPPAACGRGARQRDAGARGNGGHCVPHTVVPAAAWIWKDAGHCSIAARGRSFFLKSSRGGPMSGGEAGAWIRSGPGRKDSC